MRSGTITLAVVLMAGAAPAGATDFCQAVCRVDLLQDRIAAEAQRIDDLDSKLQTMGLCDGACSLNAATYAVKRPRSRCARLTRRALAGNSAAARELQKFPEYCQWPWQNYAPGSTPVARRTAAE